MPHPLRSSDQALGSLDFHQDIKLERVVPIYPTLSPACAEFSITINTVCSGERNSRIISVLLNLFISQTEYVMPFPKCYSSITITVSTYSNVIIQSSSHQIKHVVRPAENETPALRAQIPDPQRQDDGGGVGGVVRNEQQNKQKMPKVSHCVENKMYSYDFAKNKYTIII